MIINVNEHHISTGTKNNCYKCPIALAIRDMMENDEFVECGKSFIFIDKVHYDLLKEVSDFIRNFDREVPKEELIKPFSFELDYEYGIK